jgi:hypothetical protein
MLPPLPLDRREVVQFVPGPETASILAAMYRDIDAVQITAALEDPKREWYLISVPLL